MSRPAGVAPEYLRMARDWPQAQSPTVRHGALRSASAESASATPTTHDPHAGARVGRDHLTVGGSATVLNIEHPPENLERFLASERRRVRYTTDLSSLRNDMRLVVSPPDIEEHLRALRHHGILVLSGKPHTGLPTAVRHRAWRLAEDLHSSSVHPLFPDDLEELCKSIDELEQPTVLFVDLRDDHASASHLAAVLPQLQASLRERSSHLSVAIGHEFHEAVKTALPDAVFALRQPPPRAVITAYLRDEAGQRYLDAVLNDERFQNLIAPSWPPRLRRLAELINTAPGGLPIGQLFEQSKDGLDNWTDDLQRRFEGDIDASSRSLIVAAAILEGAPIERIVRAARDFVTMVDYGIDRPHLLEEPSLTSEFEQIAPIFDPARSQFLRSGYGDAVLPHVWSEYPRWRDPLRRWFDRLLLKPDYLDDESLARVVVRLVGLAARQSAPGLITQAASKIAGQAGRAPGEQLTETAVERGYVELAAQLLLEGAVDPLLGKQVRDQLYKWAYRENTSVSLQLATATTCGNDGYASQYPSNALTRFRHLARSDDRRVITAVLAGMAAVAVYTRPQLILTKLTDWIDSGDERIMRRIPSIVAAIFEDPRVRDSLVAAPDTVTNDPGRRISRFWQRLFNSAEPSQVRSSVQAWLGAAARLRADAAEAMAGHLVVAARRDYRGIGQLTFAVRAGLPLDPDADAVGRLQLSIMSTLLTTKEVRP